MATTTTATTEKPAYLGLLNAISLAESHAGEYLTAWANVTPDEDLACTLRLVAARETSHGQVFCRRIAELGYALKPKHDPEAYTRLCKYADPNVSDVEKIGPERDNGEVRDAFKEIKQRMADGAYDAMTCNLLGWYIAEEEDSGRRLRDAYASARAKAKGRSVMTNGSGSHASADAEAIMACMTEGFLRLERTLEKVAKAKR